MRNPMQDAEYPSDLDLYDDTIFRLLNPHHQEGYAEYGMEQDFGVILNLINHLPKGSWTQARIEATLAILHHFSYADNDENEPTVYTMLRGRAPAPLLRRHLKDIVDHISLSIKTGVYYHLTQHQGLVRELKDWGSQKRTKPLDSSSWLAAVHPKYKEIDWSQAKDPVATLLSLRAAHPHTPEQEQITWWENMLVHEKREKWTGSLRHSTFVAASEDCSFLPNSILEKYIARCEVDREFLFKLPELAELRQKHYRHEPLNSVNPFWLQYKLARLDLLQPEAGEDIEIRREKQTLANIYSEELEQVANPSLMEEYLRMIFTQNDETIALLKKGIQKGWHLVLTKGLSPEFKDSLSLLYDDLSTLTVARVYIESKYSAVSHEKTDLPDDLFNDDIFKIV